MLCGRRKRSDRRQIDALRSLNTKKPQAHQQYAYGPRNCLHALVTAHTFASGAHSGYVRWCHPRRGEFLLYEDSYDYAQIKKIFLFTIRAA